MPNQTDTRQAEPREPQLECRQKPPGTTLRDDALAIYAALVGVERFVTYQTAAKSAFDAARAFQAEAERQAENPMKVFLDERTKDDD